MKYDLIDKLCPNEANPPCLQSKIDRFLFQNPNVDENRFNEILADLELVSFAKGMRTAYQLHDELLNDML